MGLEYDDDTDDDVSKENYEEDVGVLTKIVDSFDGIDDRIDDGIDSLLHDLIINDFSVSGK